MVKLLFTFEDILSTSTYRPFLFLEITSDLLDFVL